MKLNRLFYGFAAAAAATLLLTACGSKSDSSTSADNASALAKKPRVKKGTIEVYMPEGKNADYLRKSLSYYNKKYDASLKLKVVDTAPAVPMVQKVTPKLVANEQMPDMIFLQDSNAGSVFKRFENKFYSSEDFGFIKKHGKEFYEAKMNMIKNIAPSKKTFGFPNDWGNSAMFYNDAAFKSAGVDMSTVKTWDQLIDAGKKLKAKTGKNLLFMRNTGELDLVKYLTEQQGISMFDKKGNLNLTQPEVKKTYEILQKIQDADIVSYGNSKDYTAIGQETGTMFVGGWEASYQGTDFPKDTGKWRIAAMPAVEEGKKSYAPMSGGSSYYIPKKSKNGLAAMQFISFALTDKPSLEEYMNLSGLPANMTAYDTKAAEKEFPYYGNQKILQTLNEISKTSIKGYVFPYTADLDNYIEAASYDIQKNHMSVDKALTKQANDFAAKYNVKVNK